MIDGDGCCIRTDRDRGDTRRVLRQVEAVRQQLRFMDLDECGQCVGHPPHDVEVGLDGVLPRLPCVDLLLLDARSTPRHDMGALRQTW